MREELIARHNETRRAAWQVGEHVYIGPESIGPMSARWESSMTHWLRYTDVHEAAGWQMVHEADESRRETEGNGESSVWDIDGTRVFAANRGGVLWVHDVT